MEQFNSFLELQHVDTKGTLQLLLQTVYARGDSEDFGAIITNLEKQIRAYESALRTAIESNYKDGDKKTAAAILTVAVSACDKSRREQATLFGVNDSQISTAVR